jgi:hypothetical protein
LRFIAFSLADKILGVNRLSIAARQTAKTAEMSKLKPPGSWRVKGKVDKFTNVLLTYSNQKKSLLLQAQRAMVLSLKKSPSIKDVQ